LRSLCLTVKKLYAKNVYAYSADEDRVLENKRWSLYDCLVFEHALRGKYFILSNGQWLRVEAGFYKAIMDFVGNTLREEHSEATFRNIDISDDVEKKNLESIFNRKVVEIRPSCRDPSVSDDN